MFPVALICSEDGLNSKHELLSQRPPKLLLGVSIFLLQYM